MTADLSALVRVCECVCVCVCVCVCPHVCDCGPLSQEDEPPSLSS